MAFMTAAHQGGHTHTRMHACMQRHCSVLGVNAEEQLRASVEHDAPTTAPPTTETQTQRKPGEITSSV